MVTQFSYTPWGRRSERTTTIDGKTLTREKRTYDKYGRLVLVDTGAHRMTCAYDEKNRLSTQTVDNLPIEITYTKYGQIEAKYFGGKARPLSTLRYEYDKKGRIVKKTQDGIEQNFSYDKKGQLVRVTDGQGRIAEEYAYDRAGNLAWKKEGGTLTEYSYDRANQLVSATKNKETTAYAYDAAGRMIREGSRGYRYAGADKVVSVEEKGKTIYRYDYWSDGQLAHAEGMDGVREEFLWDNLALIRRGAIEYLNEPSPTGGNPVAATGKVFFNDLLGTTLAAKGKETLEKLPVSAFGAAADLVEHQFFTGKPYVQGLGYAFLMRNYRSDLGKWQTADPLGYPDGWNAFAYCKNGVVSAVDIFGALTVHVWNYEGGSLGKGAWGHASIELDNGTYISWWPEEGVSWDDNTYIRPAIPNRQKEDDIDDEGCEPDSSIHIDGLDEDSIEDWWNEFKDDPKHYWAPLTSNCSTIVAKALQHGKPPKSDLDDTDIWTPEEIRKYANDIKNKLSE